MWAWFDRLSFILLRAGTGAAVLSSVVMLVMLGCRQPARRIVLARAAVAGSLVLIPLVGLNPVPRLDVSAALRHWGILAHPLVSSLPRLGLPVRPVARILSALYLVGMGVCLSDLFVGYLGLGWLTRQSTLPSPRTLAVYEAMAAGRRRRPRLRVARRIHRPVLVGTFRPIILIPAALDPERPDASATEALRLSLLHELAHASRCDPWFSLLASLARSVWFPLPPIWWIRAQMVLDHEFLADRRAAGGFGPPETYASELVAMAAPRPDFRRGYPVSPSDSEPPSSAAKSPLLQRILMLVSCPFPVEHRPPAWWRWSLPTIILLLVPLAASVSLDSVPAAATSTSGPRAFEVSRLTISPRSPGRDGRAPSFELPLVLPGQFELTAQVWGDSSTLACCRVAGQRLGCSDQNRAGAPGTSREPETWHDVQIQQGPRNLSLTVDGRPVLQDPTVDRLTSQLSVEPAPGQLFRLRGLRLTW
jgi:beta-lactamase regulating signal transducer with metallopeptidase domain